LSATGQVQVNGQNAISGATVFSDSTVTTAKGSSAVVSLGKLGRVEVLPDSNMKLSFTDASVTVHLDAGRVRLSTPSGVTPSVITKDGTATGDSAQANVFNVDTECGNMIVATQSGNVELRAADKTTQIAAGSQDTAGQAAPGTRCTRLRTEGMKGIGGGALAALLLAAGGAIAAAIFAGRSENNDLNFGGTVTVVSPTK
jgi:ferric-dicitrate binding protein FerR (iron transport regulator)